MQGGDLRPVLVAPRRQHDRHGLPADGVQLDGQPMREPVVAADHHVLGALPKFPTKMQS